MKDMVHMGTPELQVRLGCLHQTFFFYKEASVLLIDGNDVSQNTTVNLAVPVCHAKVLCFAMQSRERKSNHELNPKLNIRDTQNYIFSKLSRWVD